jgi:hypothetical protein
VVAPGRRWLVDHLKQMGDNVEQLEWSLNHALFGEWKIAKLFEFFL